MGGHNDEFLLLGGSYLQPLFLQKYNRPPRLVINDWFLKYMLLAMVCSVMSYPNELF